MHFFGGNVTSALTTFTAFRTTRDGSESVNDVEDFVALLASGICEYFNGDELEAKKCYKAAYSISKELKLFGSDPAAKKALKNSHKTSQNHNYLSDIYGRIKRAILMRERSKEEEGTLAEKSSQNKIGTWFYYLHNDPFNKEDGWYAFTADMCKQVERMHKKYVAAKRPEGLSMMILSHGTILREYEIDFQAMQQTNRMSRTTRPIKRSLDGHLPDGHLPYTRHPSPLALY